MSEENQPIVVDAQQVITGDEKLWVILSHASFLFGAAVFLPLIVFLWKREQSEVVAYHSKEALNFHISFFIYTICCFPLVLIFIGFPLVIALSIVALVFSIIATVKGSEGVPYRYPMTIRLIT